MNRIINEVNNIFNQYLNEIQKIPQIKKVKLLDSDSGIVAQFLSKDLFDKNYILYVNETFMSNRHEYRKQKLFHEFTHLADSIVIKQICHDKEKFSKVMCLYSEIHASSIEMKEIINTSYDGRPNINSTVVTNGALSIKYLMEQTYNFFIKEFNRNSELTIETSDEYEIIHMLYFYGYLHGLNQQGINFSYYLMNDIPSKFVAVCEKLKDILLEPNIDIENICKISDELDNAFKEYVFSNKENPLEKILMNLGIDISKI